MHKLKLNDSWLGADKSVHFAGCLIIAGLVGLLFTPIVGLVVSILVAIGKEVYDAHGHGTPSLQDAVISIIGAIVGYVCLLLL